MTLVITRATKQAARYTDAGGRERCSACRFFMPQGTCGRIIGPVSPRGWCRFYSQEAVQRWQPQGAQGQGGSPTLDLSFISGSGTLDSRIVFTRASTATYFDSSGVMRTAASGAPRFDYDPATLALRGLLIEEARTNITTNSGPLTDFAAAAATKTSNVLLAPDGTTAGMRLIEDVSTGVHLASFSIATVTANAVYTGTVFAKAGARTKVSLQFRVGGAWVGGVLSSVFDLSAVTAAVAYGTGAVSIRAVGNGWYRLSVTVTAVAAPPAATMWVALLDATGTESYTGNGTGDAYFWGAQLEVGAFPTSYIPTTAAAATRAVELATMPTAAWYNAAAGTIVSDMIPQLNGNANQDWPTLSAGDGVNLYNIRTTGTLGQVIVFVANANVGAVATGNGLTFGVRASLGVSYDAGTRAVTVGLNGGTPATVTASSLPVVNLIQMGLSRTINPNCWHRRVRYWPRVLSNAELQSVTT